MSQLIAVISQKGGVGKSTTTILLANMFFFVFKLKVAVIDADYPQNSIAKRRKRELAITKDNPHLQALYNKIYLDKDPYTIIPTNLPSTLTILHQLLQADYDFIFLDVTGTLNQDALREVLLHVNHFLIPALEDEFSVLTAVEVYEMLHQKIVPHSKAFVDCHIYFNKVPRMNIIPSLLKQLTPFFQFLPAQIYEYKGYERRYRSTVFPIPRTKKEGIRLLEFAKQFYAIIKPKVISH